MTFQYTNYKVEIKNLKFTTDDGRVFPKTAIVTLLDNNNQKISVELFGYIESDKLYEMIENGEEINLDHCLIRNFSLSVYRAEHGLGKKEYIKLKGFSASNAFFDSKFGIDFSFSEIEKGDISFENTHFARGNISFHSVKFGNGNISFERTEFGDSELTFDRTDFGIGDISFHNSRVHKLSMKSCHLDHYLDLRVAKCDTLDLSDTIARDIIDLQPYDFDVDIRLLDLTGMRLLGRVNIDWQSNRIEKMIKEQDHSSCRQLAEQFRMLKENFNLSGKYNDEDKAYIQFKRFEARASLQESIKRNPLNALWKYPAKAFQWLIFDQVGFYATNP